MKKRSVTIPDEAVIRRIHVIRGQKVMLDRDLAELYGVETRRLNEQVRRNIDRFPEDFMFEMTSEELADWKSQFATSNREVMGLRKRPLVFTEHGVLMLSSVLNSKTAVAVNIQIIR
ncbi:MAG: ORF6N domain-containing protein, partial [Flavobacteriales bacterium]|nr:ORF6N domain-containing protein [Flavobacteriales bacterium]